jgi:hypothetical protein
VSDCAEPTDAYAPPLRSSDAPAVAVSVAPAASAAYVNVSLPAGVKVIFWAANPGAGTGQTPRQAYSGGAPNGGVTTTSDEGVAHITLACPQNYKVSRLGIDSTLPKHVHLRYALPGRPGLFSPVLTKEIDADCQ